MKHRYLLVALVIVLSSLALVSTGAPGRASTTAAVRGTPTPTPEGGVEEPFVIGPVTPHVADVDLRSLPRSPGWQPGDPVREVPRRVYPRENGPASLPGIPGGDPLLALQEGAALAAPSAFGTLILNFAGIGYQGVVPPDPVGDVGPNHYIQMTNTGNGSRVLVTDKSGTTLAGPFDLNTLWTAGGNCATGHGDPIVLYDRLADRWLMSEFANTGNHLCVYISKTSSPVSGGWWLYDFPTPVFPDYPKYGVWPDAYYVSTNESSPAVYALDRTQMLAGGAATAQRKTATQLAGFGFQALIPSDLDGATGPPAGSPNYFARHRDDEAHNAGSNNPTQDYIEIWEFDVDFATPANTTFALAHTIATSEFDSDLCGLTSFECFPQPGTSTKLDPLREVVMWRLQYLNFGTHETLMGNLVTDVSGSDHGGIRWFELRKVGAGSWTLQQEGTYAPDSLHRWMGSIAMDQSGNVALAYSVSNASSVYPSIRYTGRLAGDTAGTMPRGEHTVVAGASSQTTSTRWGDYSSMNVDPADDCTFWYTNEYMPAGGSWTTRIATFKFPTCQAGPDFTVDVEPASLGMCVASTATYTVAVGAVGGYSDTVALSAVGNPAGTSTWFGATPVTAPATTTLTISDTAAATGTYSIGVVGVGPTSTHTTTVQLALYDTGPGAPSPSTPIDGSAGVVVTPTFAWSSVASAHGYDLEVATDSLFGSVVLSPTGLADPTYTPGTSLITDTVYYWRARANNPCGAGTWSTVYAFRTEGGALSCTTYSSTDVPKVIPEDGSASSTLSVGSGGAIADLNVVDLAGTGYVNDLTFDLTSPSATTVRILDRPCGVFDLNFDLDLDDEAAAAYPCPPTGGGAYLPDNALSAFDGEARAGTWTLFVDDHYIDSEQLSTWGIEICSAQALTPSDHSDLAGSYGVAWHGGNGALKLGSTWDADTGFTAGSDDASDDGVTYDRRTAWEPGQPATITVDVAGCSGYLAGWFDWNDDGDFVDAQDKRIGQSVGVGSNTIVFTVPAAAGYTAGREIDARFRLYVTEPLLAPLGTESQEGYASHGEVEDYSWRFYPSNVMLPLVLRSY